MSITKTLNTKARTRKKTPRGVRKARPARRKTSSKRSPYRPVDDEWDNFKTRTRIAIQSAIEKQKSTYLSPYERPDGLLRRLTYEFIVDRRCLKSFRHLEDAIEAERYTGRPFRVKFKDNPFHWILSALTALDFGEGFKLDKYSVRKYAGQLLYAERHNIPVELLIGFIYQSGDANHILEKADEPLRREPWFKASHSWEYVNRERISSS